MKKIIIALTVFGLMAASSMAVIVMENSGSASVAIPGNAATNLTLTGFANSGNYVLVGAVTKDKEGALTGVSGISYNGAGMTLLGQSLISEGYEIIIDIYGLATSDATGDVVMSYDLGNGTDAFVGTGFMAMSYSGVASVGVLSDGISTLSTVTTLTDTTTTTATTAGSMLANFFSSANSTTYTSSDVQFADGNANSGGLYNTTINSAGAYDIVGAWAAGGGRATGLGVELIADALVPTTAPPTPADLALTEGFGVMDLTWTDNSDIENGFIIERGLDGVSYTAITTTAQNATNYTDSGLAYGTLYYYRLSATNIVGVSAATNASATTLTLPLPSAPTNLVVAAGAVGVIDLSWTDTSPVEDGFIISRGPGTNSLVAVATNVANDATYSDTGLADDTEYFYKVVAFNIIGSSTGTLVESATTLPAVASTAIVMEGSASTSENPAAQSGTLTLDAFGSAGNYVVVAVTAKNRGDLATSAASPFSTITYGGGSAISAVGSASNYWNSYTYHTALYVFAAGSAGAIDVAYTMAEDNDFDAISVVAARYSGVDSFAGFTSASAPVSNAALSFATTVTTTGTDSMIVGAFGIGNANGVLSMTDGEVVPTSYTTVIGSETTSGRSNTGMFELSAATVGTYGMVGYTTDNDRGALVGIELTSGGVVDPSPPASVLTLISGGGGEDIIDWTTAPGFTYSILYSTNLSSGFLSLETNLTDTVQSWTNTIDASPVFYKVEAQ